MSLWAMTVGPTTRTRGEVYDKGYENGLDHVGDKEGLLQRGAWPQGWECYHGPPGNLASWTMPTRTTRTGNQEDHKDYNGGPNHKDDK